MTERRFVHVTISGHVQGVGFRAYLDHHAQTRGLDGWVRNRENGCVEAVLSGSAAAVQAVLDACGRGPRGCRIDRVDVREEDAAGLIPSSRQAGFFVLPTV